MGPLLKTRTWLAAFILTTASCSTVGETSAFGATYPEYDRSEWKHWRDLDRDCQDARQEALISASEVEVSFKDAKSCKVVAGRWTDPYTGQVFTDPSDLDVDHIVALKDAHDSGGYAWTAEQKMRFANDPWNLIPVSASANRSKGSRGPDEWLPVNEAYRCSYLYRWEGMKEKYALSMSEGERAVVEYMIYSCESLHIPALPQ